MPAPATPTLITSVIKALTLLDAVSWERGPVPAKKLAQVTGIPLPTTYHLLRTLLYEGYVHKRDGGYVLGERVATLSRRQRLTAMDDRSRAVLQDLRDEVHAAAYFATLEDGQVRLVDVADGPQAPRVHMWVGFDEAAHATAIGKAILTALPQDQRREFLASHPLVDLTRATVTSTQALLQELRRHPDVATDEQEYDVGAACLAVSVPSPSVVCAVAVSVPIERRSRLSGCQDAVRRAARSLALVQETGRA